MAERTVVFVSDGRCTHCGMKHEPWVVVCPVTRQPLVTRGVPMGGSHAHEHAPPAPAAIPASPPVPVAPPRGVIPPSPAIPRALPGVQARTNSAPQAANSAPQAGPGVPQGRQRTIPGLAPRLDPGVPRPAPSPAATPPRPITTPAIPQLPGIPGVDQAAGGRAMRRATPAMGVPLPGMPGPTPTYAAQSQPQSPASQRVHPAVQPPQATAPAASGPPSARGLVGRVISERYAVRGVIGEGGMGVVYEAEQLTIRKMVAIKVLHPSKAQNREAVSRLRHEARVAGTLGHPNICAVYDLGLLDDGSPYLVMERLYGETLAQRLERLQRLPAAEMVDIMLQVLSALAAAHQRSVIHRDLKPENIFLSQRERDGLHPVPKLLDFGISKAEDIEETIADPTGQRLAAGTPYYMAPEQARGDRGLDWRVDLWSAGVVLFEGLTGQRPFQAKNYNALLVQILSMAHRPMRELDPEMLPSLCRVVDKALSKRPDDRFQSAVEFQSALRAYKDEEGPRMAMPILLSEQTFDDSDETTVFQRVKLEQIINQTSVEEDATPIYGPTGSEPADDEHTVVETPAFLVERTVVMSNPVQPRVPSEPKPGRKA